MSSKCEVHATRGVAGQPPDIWLTVETDIVRPAIVRLTIEEAFELAHRILVEAAEAANLARATVTVEPRSPTSS
jgi:hypothetical protein